MWMVIGPEKCDELKDVQPEKRMPLFFGQTVVIRKRSVEFCLLGVDHGTLQGLRVDLTLPMATFRVGRRFMIETRVEATPLNVNMTKNVKGLVGSDFQCRVIYAKLKFLIFQDPINTPRWFYRWNPRFENVAFGSAGAIRFNWWNATNRHYTYVHYVCAGEFCILYFACYNFHITRFSRSLL